MFEKKGSKLEYSVEKYWELFGGLQNWRIIIVCKLSNKIKPNLKLNKQSEHLPRERVSRREENKGPRFRWGSTCSHWYGFANCQTDPC